MSAQQPCRRCGVATEPRTYELTWCDQCAVDGLHNFVSDEVATLRAALALATSQREIAVRGLSDARRFISVAGEAAWTWTSDGCQFCGDRCCDEDAPMTEKCEARQRLCTALRDALADAEAKVARLEAVAAATVAEWNRHRSWGRDLPQVFWNKMEALGAAIGAESAPSFPFGALVSRSVGGCTWVCHSCCAKTDIPPHLRLSQHHSAWWDGKEFAKHQHHTGAPNGGCPLPTACRDCGSAAPAPPADTAPTKVCSVCKTEGRGGSCCYATGAKPADTAPPSAKETK